MPEKEEVKKRKVLKNKKKLSVEQLKVLREGATEAPFSGALLDNKRTGMYVCGYCGQELFSSEHKFDSGSGWPSFDRVVKDGHVKLITDNSHDMIRTEAKCANCDSHLGHVFDDGPADTTGQRFCINSLALDFEVKDGK
jgi:peptide-methionine (R)-S-oxide reductase